MADGNSCRRQRQKVPNTLARQIRSHLAKRPARDPVSACTCRQSTAVQGRSSRYPLGFPRVGRRPSSGRPELNQDYVGGRDRLGAGWLEGGRRVPSRRSADAAAASATGRMVRRRRGIAADNDRALLFSGFDIRERFLAPDERSRHIHRAVEGVLPRARPRRDSSKRLRDRIGTCPIRTDCVG